MHYYSLLVTRDRGQVVLVTKFPVLLLYISPELGAGCQHCVDSKFTTDDLLRIDVEMSLYSSHYFSIFNSAYFSLPDVRCLRTRSETWNIFLDRIATIRKRTPTGKSNVKTRLGITSDLAASRVTAKDIFVTYILNSNHPAVTFVL